MDEEAIDLPDDEPDVECIVESLQVLTLQEGDAIVVTYEGQHSPGERSYLRQLWEEEFPGHRVIVLTGGTTLGVLRREKSGDVPSE